MINRLSKLSKTNSFFLFGPRGSGKTTWLLQYFEAQNTLYLDLLDLNLIQEFQLEPQRFIDLISTSSNLNKRIIIDEIQKFPKLLDLIHAEIQKNKRQFIMTGSSTRKLKQQSVNLLAGRAWVYNLYPFSIFELEANKTNSLNLKNYLEFGFLPEIIHFTENLDKKEFLNAYVSLYLEKEIQLEQWVKNLEPFRKFLSVAAQMNGKIINKSKIAREVGVESSTIQNYFDILYDTLIAIELPAFHKSVRKAQKLASKMYFIDPGIKRALDRTLSVEVLPQTYMYGDGFEHVVILEFTKLISYNRLDWKMYYLKTKDDVEIDLIIDRPGLSTLLIEIKSTDRTGEEHVKSLESLGPDIKKQSGTKIDKYLFSQDRLERKIKTTNAIYWIDGLKKIFEIER